MVAVKVQKAPARRKKKAQITAVRIGGFQLDGRAEDAETETAAAAAARPSNQEPDAVPDVTDTGLCVEILMAGYVQSYVDFFYLTHRPDPSAAPDADGSRKEIVVSPSDMVKIKASAVLYCFRLRARLPRRRSR